MSAAIVIPSLRVDALLRRCVAECARWSPEVEILVYVDDATGSEHLAGRAKVTETGPVTIAEKRNRGAADSNAEFLAFIDSDAYPVSDWLDNAVGFLRAHREYAAVGGPNVSPPDEPTGERWVGLAHNSFLVAGWWRYRRDPSADEREVGALPSCNLVVRAADYRAVGGMNERLFTAEDTDFCRRFCASGRRIYFTPDVQVFHKNRNMWHFVVQRFTFGVAMVPLLRKGTAPDRGYLVASALLALFVLFVLSGPVAWWWSWWGWLWAVSMAAYLALILIEAVRQARRWSDVAGVAVALLVGNLAPGVGFVLKAVRLAPDLRGVYRNDR